MKVLLYKLIDVLMWIPGKLLSEKVVVYWSLLMDAFYAARVRHRFSKAPGLIMLGHPIRIRGGKRIELGEAVTLGKDCRIEATEYWRGRYYAPRITIGEHSVLPPLCHIGCIDEVRIGKFVSFGTRTYITDHIHGESTYEHVILPPRHRPLYSKGRVVIGDYSMLGENCAILPGVTIGEHCVIGSNSVVTKDIPPFSVAAGVPAKVIKTIEPPTVANA